MRVLNTLCSMLKIAVFFIVIKIYAVTLKYPIYRKKVVKTAQLVKICGSYISTAACNKPFLTPYFLAYRNAISYLVIRS